MRAFRGAAGVAAAAALCMPLAAPAASAGVLGAAPGAAEPSGYCFVPTSPEALAWREYLDSPTALRFAPAPLPAGKNGPAAAQLKKRDEGGRLAPRGAGSPALTLGVEPTSSSWRVVAPGGGRPRPDVSLPAGLVVNEIPDATAARIGADSFLWRWGVRGAQADTVIDAGGLPDAARLLVAATVVDAPAGGRMEFALAPGTGFDFAGGTQAAKSLWAGQSARLRVRPTLPGTYRLRLSFTVVTGADRHEAGEAILAYAVGNEAVNAVRVASGRGSSLPQTPRSRPPAAVKICEPAKPGRPETPAQPAPQVPGSEVPAAPTPSPVPTVPAPPSPSASESPAPDPASSTPAPQPAPPPAPNPGGEAPKPATPVPAPGSGSALTPGLEPVLPKPKPVPVTPPPAHPGRPATPEENRPTAAAGSTPPAAIPEGRPQGAATPPPAGVETGPGQAGLPPAAGPGAGSEDERSQTPRNPVLAGPALRSRAGEGYAPSPDQRWRPGGDNPRYAAPLVTTPEVGSAPEGWQPAEPGTPGPTPDGSDMLATRVPNRAGSDYAPEGSGKSDSVGAYVLAGLGAVAAAGALGVFGWLIIGIARNARRSRP